MNLPRNLLVHIPGARAGATTRTDAPLARRVGRLGYIAPSPQHKAANRRSQIGVWDLGAWLSNLPQLLNRLNAVQRSFSFFLVQAMVPSGLIREREGVIAWFTKLLGGRPLSKRRRDEIASNVIDDDFFAVAERVRADLAVDYLVGVTPSMIAGMDDEDRPIWNYFSTGIGRLGLASTADLRKFAARTGRPFEAYLGMIIVAQVLAVMFPKIDYHEDTGCLFDFNDERVSIMKTLKNLHVDPPCLKAIPARHRPAVHSMVNLLRNYPKA
jgi:hypothetical protein